MYVCNLIFTTMWVKYVTKIFFDIELLNILKAKICVCAYVCCSFTLNQLNANEEEGQNTMFNFIDFQYAVLHSLLYHFIHYKSSFQSLRSDSSGRRHTLFGKSCILTQLCWIPNLLFGMKQDASQAKYCIVLPYLG